MATLSAVALSKHFGTVHAVDQIDLHVDDGEFLCILGPSGCGKSTLLRMIGGFEMPTSGDILIDGQSVLMLPANRRPTAMVFQKYTLWPHMRVFDNIAFGLRLRHMTPTEIARQVGESLEMVGMNDFATRYPAQLSGGQQQRVALARALVLKPKILLLDEPFSNLDALLRVRLREELRRIQRQVRITAVFVTHDQEEALTLADRIAVMNAGQVDQVDAPDVIYAQPSSLFVADFIGVMNLLPGEQSGAQITIGALQLPAVDSAEGQVTVAVRPEDIVMTPSANGGTSSQGVIEHLIDLGHYRKALVTSAGTTLKVYAAKSAPIREGDSVSLFFSRYLVYKEGREPLEVKRNPPQTGILSGIEKVGEA